MRWFVKETRSLASSAGDDILEANVVILADGVNSMLGRSLGMVPASEPHHYAVGVKEVIGLTPEQINDRFNITGEEGAASAVCRFPF